MDSRKDKKARQPIVDGIFYPADPGELKTLIHSYIDSKNYGSSSVIYSPHAGYSAAGAMMGKAFCSAAKKQVREVVIISPVHREETDSIILPRFTSFATPLGSVPISMKSLHLFQNSDKSIIRDDIPHLEEHSIEDQLPFIQVLFPEASILPILVGKSTIGLVKKIREGLTRAFGQDRDGVLFVATGNLSSYSNREQAIYAADKALNIFSKGNWKEIVEDARTNGIEACGAASLAAILSFIPTPLTMKILDRVEAEYIELEKGKTVSYGALSFIEED